MQVIMLSKSLLVGGLGLLYSCAFATTKVPEYDNVPITPQTWQEVDLTYDNYIDGKQYTEQVKLLRPISWLKKRNLDTRHLNKSVHLTKDDIGADINVKIAAIKPARIYFDNESVAKNLKRPVIGVFIRYANNVTDYTFKDKSGKFETIQATPEHPFYSINRHDYIPIGQIWQESLKNKKKEPIQTEIGKYVILINAKSHNRQVEAVYNFEVYQKHSYTVGKFAILVHNVCGYTEQKTAEINRIHTNIETNLTDSLMEVSTVTEADELLQNTLSGYNIPDYVFRGDKRDIKHILDNGFEPQEQSFSDITDNEIINHMGSNDGRLISSSRDPQIASNFSKTFTIDGEDVRPVYVISTKGIKSKFVPKVLKDSSKQQDYLGLLHEEEVVFLERVPSKNIIGFINWRKDKTKIYR
jgi:hypothetical protein